MRGEVGNRPLSNDGCVADRFTFDVFLTGQACLEHAIDSQTPVGVLHDRYDVLGADGLDPVRHLRVKERVGRGNAEDVWVLPARNDVGPGFRDNQGELTIIRYLDLCLGHCTVELADHTHSPRIGESVHRRRSLFG